MIKWLVLGLDILLGLYLINLKLAKWTVPAALKSAEVYIFILAGVLIIISGIGFFFWRSANEQPPHQR